MYFFESIFFQLTADKRINKIKTKRTANDLWEMCLSQLSQAKMNNATYIEFFIIVA